MIIIGEKINGTRKKVGEAILKRDADFIRDLALRQVEAGINLLDVNAGGKVEEETDALIWLVDTIQKATDVPLCLDSANPSALAAAIDYMKQTPMINSINGKKEHLDSILPLVLKNKCPVIVLTMDDKGIPKTTEQRIAIIDGVIEEMRRKNHPDELLYIDPLAMALAVDTEAGKITLDTIRTIRRKYPDVHIVSGLSNVSFGLPARSLINRSFLTLAIDAGMDSAILDPLDKKLMSTIAASELVLGKDRFCRNYNKAFRVGRLEY